ncbi:MAG: transposase [Candidatus Pacebacteria bacterium]|nr:transposase [Candidatus Paceibacterota bacterium]
MKLARRNFSREFKLQVCYEVESGSKTQAQASREYMVESNLISQWMKQYRQDPINCFSGRNKYPVDTQAANITELEAALGRATYENQILREANTLLKKIKSIKTNLRNDYSLENSLLNNSHLRCTWCKS